MPRNEHIQSLERATKILYVVAGVENGCTINQISAQTGIKANTAYRIVRSLEKEHFLLRRTNPLRFTIGQSISELKHLDDTRKLLTSAGKVLVRHQAQIPFATLVFLELRNGINYMRLSVQSNRPGQLIQHRESVIPLYSKASSLLFMAFAPPHEILQFRSNYPFKKHGKSIWGTETKLEAYLSDVRRLGYSAPTITDPEGPNYRVAAPVFSSGNELVGAIGGYILDSAPQKNRILLIRNCKAAANYLSKNIQKDNKDHITRSKTS
ncbi:helix-turn-helix domain-containing protein [Rubellicoccus peritrichatus]|uniref:Helix-turn-helix domain-containing protein n=1 Tax=Rubellicoccus peritrichatus TaxID=3080537 RepID=A0AAQ3LDR3_9BACT|nr:helix-turn-helix domain-containing protein [Puniceicoccus sp. CR14]WOO43616.1 helix-turn-helix domain-containing protein [Puniceicoccus sp. CR14]